MNPRFKILTNDVVRARIKPEIKAEAAAVLETMGLTVSDAVRMLLTRLAIEKALPFSPSPETIAAMEAARKGELHVADSANDLLDQLNDD